MAKKKSDKPIPREQSINYRHVGVILTVGIILRVIYNWHLSESIFFGHYLIDGLMHHSWAQAIISGTTADTAFFRAPLYPYILALLYKVFGQSPWSYIIFQNILGLLTSVVTYFFGKRMFGEKVGFWSGLLTAMFPLLIYYEGEAMLTTLEVFLYTLSIYQLYQLLTSTQQQRNKYLIATGLAFGLAAITRPVILPLLLLFPLGHFLKYGKNALKDNLLSTVKLGLVFLIPVLPVTFTNLVKGGEFVLISSQGGANFYIGNSPEADGISVKALGPQLRIGKYNDNVWTSSVDEAEKRVGRKMTQGEVSSYWFREGLKWIAGNPVQAARLFAKKFYYFWHGQEIFNNKSYYQAREYSWLLSILLWKGFINFPSGLFFPLVLVGMFLAWRKEASSRISILYIVLFSIIISSFFVCARFRQPIVPLAGIFAVYAVSMFKEQFKSNRRNLITTTVSVLLFVIVLNWGGNIESKQNMSQFNAVVGSVYLAKKDYSTSIGYLEESLEILPDNMGVYDFLGTAYLESNQVDKAEEVYEKGLELFPVYPVFNYNLGKIAQMRNNIEAAKGFYYKTLEYAPAFGPAIDRLGYVFSVEQQYDSALVYYKRLAAVQRNNPGLEVRIRELEALTKGAR